MAKCVNCGRNLNAFNVAYPLWDGTNEHFCTGCYEKFKKIRSVIESCNVPSRDEFVQEQSFFLTANGFSQSIQHIADYYDYLLISKEKAEKEKELAIQQIMHEAEREAALPKILISSGFSFDGYNIVKYSGYISGDDAIQINRDDLFLQAGQNLTDALVIIRTRALKELKEAAYDLGCNAVIGVDFDYLTFQPETANSMGGTTYHPYVVCVTANGNAVIIEKE